MPTANSTSSVTTIAVPTLPIIPVGEGRFRVPVSHAGEAGDYIVNLASWTVGLSLIVLTIAIHTTGVVLMAFGLETRSIP
jgi:hypothetical protein